MKYRVEYTEAFVRDVEAHIDYLLGQGAPTETIAAWYDALFARLDRLDEMPKRLAVDPRQSQICGFEVRKLHHNDYIAFYAVDEQGCRVSLLKFQHGTRERSRWTP